jgi:hypothetical protein
MGKLRVDVGMVVEVRAFRDALPKSFNIELRDIMVLYCIVDERVTWWWTELDRVRRRGFVRRGMVGWRWLDGGMRNAVELEAKLELGIYPTPKREETVPYGAH